MLIKDAKTRISDVQNSLLLKPKRTSAFNDRTRTEITHLRLDQLIPYSKQARTVFDEDELKSLSLTIQEHGIRQPLTVLRSRQEEGKYEIISGERRFRAAKLADLKVVPCIIIDDADKAEEISLVENIQRKDLHPVELSRALKSLVDLRGWGSQRELKNKLGLAESVVSELLKINTLTDEVRSYLVLKNIRSREVLRQLFKIETGDKQIGFLKSLEDVQDVQDLSSPSKSKVKRLPYRSSVVRVFLEAGDVHVQKTRLKNLTVSEKEKLKCALQEMIRDLDEGEALI